MEIENCFLPGKEHTAGDVLVGDPEPWGAFSG